jgi:hydroxymethylglutaryl-CoA lyase
MTTLSDNLPDRVSLVEVGPRDGLQNERVRLTTAQKLDLIDRLVVAGFRHVEVGAFVHPKWIPQMADTAEVLRRLERRPGVAYWTLVPNERGLDAALEAGAEHIAIFLSSSETHNLRNTNRPIAESLDAYADVCSRARAAGLTIRGYVSTVFGCPYEGDVDFGRVLEIADRLLQMGVVQVSLGDTTGMGTPAQVQRGVRAALERFGPEAIALHLHDTRGVGLANALVALEVGMRTFDTSVGGMGGCPYAPGAAGNLGTEDLVHMLESSGVDTGIDLEQLLAISRWLDGDLGATLNSAYFRYARAGKSPRVTA